MRISCHFNFKIIDIHYLLKLFLVSKWAKGKQVSAFYAGRRGGSVTIPDSCFKILPAPGYNK